MTIKITGHDNRGGYGYIYYKRHKDEFRSGWTTEMGVFGTKETPDLTRSEAKALIDYSLKHKLFDASLLAYTPNT